MVKISPTRRFTGFLQFSAANGRRHIRYGYLLESAGLDIAEADKKVAEAKKDLNEVKVDAAKK